MTPSAHLSLVVVGLVPAIHDSFDGGVRIGVVRSPVRRNAPGGGVSEWDGWHASSNVNVAAVVEDHRLAGSRWLRFSDLRYDVLVETGTDLDIEVLSKSEWLDPSRSERASRVREIRRDAIDLLSEFWEEESEESP